jgi:hypothetical protein
MPVRAFRKAKLTATTTTHLDRFDFGIHELVLGGRSFQAVFRQVHRIAAIVNVSEYLHRHARRKI